MHPDDPRVGEERAAGLGYDLPNRYPSVRSRVCVVRVWVWDRDDGNVLCVRLLSGPATYDEGRGEE